MFDNEDNPRIESGIAAIHQKCLDKNSKIELIPKRSSEPDPNQGWGIFYIDGKKFR